MTIGSKSRKGDLVAAGRAYAVLADFYSKNIGAVTADEKLDIELLGNYDLSQFFNLQVTLDEFFTEHSYFLDYIRERQSYSSYFTHPIVLFAYIMGAHHPEYIKAGWKAPEGVLVSIYSDLGWSYEAVV